MTLAKHDRQDAVRNATHLFWEKGFHATSMRNLQQAIDMRPGSIYASFGSKESLFKHALQYYADSSRQRLADCVEQAESPLKGLQQFVTDIVVGCDTAPSSMCMLVKTITELTDEQADLLQEAKQLLQGMERAFATVLANAQEQGEVRADADVERLARSLQMQLMGLRTYARSNTDAADHLAGLIEDMFHAFQPTQSRFP